MKWIVRASPSRAITWCASMICWLAAIQDAASDLRFQAHSQWSSFEGVGGHPVRQESGFSCRLTTESQLTTEICTEDDDGAVIARSAELRVIGGEPEVNEMPGEVIAAAVNDGDLSEWSARVYGKQKFAGAGKSNSGLLVPLERRLAAYVLPRMPGWLETYHLTLLTPVWSLGIVAFCYLGARDLRWLWMVNLMITLNYFTDYFDGK